MRRLLPVLLLLALPACAPKPVATGPSGPPPRSLLALPEISDSVLTRFTQRDVEQRPFDSLQVQRYLYQLQRRDPDPQIVPDLVGEASAMAAEWAGARRVSSRWLGFDFVDLPDGTFLIREDTSRSIALMWRNIGLNTSGRILKHAFDPSNPRTIWAGSASGGLFKTTDGGETWHPMTDDMPAMAVSAIAVHPRDSNTLLIGTIADFGQVYPLARESGMGRYGYGVFRSTNGGVDWTVTQLSFTSEPMNCMALAWDPRNPAQVYLGASNGIWKSTDEGVSWERVLEGNVKTLVINNQHPDILYAGIVPDTSYAAAGIYRSEQGGVPGSWQRLTEGVPDTSVFRTNCGACMELTISDGFPQVLYLAIRERRDGKSSYGLYKTSDGGDHWRTVPTEDVKRFWTATVSPVDTNRVYIGGVHLYETRDGGASWDQAGTMAQLDPLYVFTLDPRYAQWLYDTHKKAESVDEGDEVVQDRLDSLDVFDEYSYDLMEIGAMIHVDQHDFGFDPVRPESVMYAFNDGGVFVSEDGGDKWAPRNNGLMTLQIYGMAGALQDTNRVALGTQDQGLLVIRPGRHEGLSLEQLEWRKWNGGDGAATVFDHQDPDNLYGVAAMGMYWHFDVPSDTVTRGVLPTMQTKRRIQRGIGGSTGNARDSLKWNPGPWIPALVIDPADARILYTADKKYVYKTANGGWDWTALRAIPNVLTMAVDQQNPSLVYAFADTLTGRSPSLWRSADGGAHWDSLAYPSHRVWPGDELSDIEADPDTEGMVYATRAGYGEQVWVSTDRGTTWVDLTTDLPQIPANAIAVTPAAWGRKQIFVGTDIGVYAAYADELRWKRVRGLPYVVINDLHLHPGDGTLRAGTYGRGVWKAKVRR